MALTFPLSRSVFADGLPIESIQFRLQNRVETSGIGTGNTLVAETGPAFWAAEIVLRAVYNKDSRAIQALIDSLDGGMSDFYLSDPIFAFPRRDPTGSILGSTTVTNIAVGSNGKQMKFNGPAGYIYSVGDMFSFDYGAGGAYRALHRIVEGDTANGSGDTGWIEFRPRLDDPDLPSGKVMDFKHPTARMKFVPGSVEYGTAKDIFTSGIAFSCEQVP